MPLDRGERMQQEQYELEAMPANCRLPSPQVRHANPCRGSPASTLVRSRARLTDPYHRRLMTESLIVAVAIGAAVLVLVAIVALKSRHSASVVLERLDELARANERLERELRTSIEASATALRMETGA